MEKTSGALRALLEEFRHKAHFPEDAVNEWKKKTGGKAVGCIGLDVPEPLIHAAGMLPVVILDRDERITLGNAHVEMHQCGYIRTVVDQVMKGELSYCDEILAHDCCHIVRMIGNVMHTFQDGMKKVEFIYFSPLLENDNAQKYTREEMAGLRKRLEDLSGNVITDEAFLSSIRLYNRQKKLLMELYDRRRARPGLLRASEVSDIVAAGMCMPKEEHIVLLERLLPLLDSDDIAVSTAVPVVVHGSLCERCDTYVLDCIENSGGVVVDDDLYVGSRYFNTLYHEDLGDPIDILLDAYRHRTAPCPTRYEERNPGEYIANMIEKANAKGVIMVIVKFCEAHDFAYFTAYRHFQERGIRQLLVEIEHDITTEGQLKTRLQGFFESVGN